MTSRNATRMLLRVKSRALRSLSETRLSRRASMLISLAIDARVISSFDW